MGPSCGAVCVDRGLARWGGPGGARSVSLLFKPSILKCSDDAEDGMLRWAPWEVGQCWWGWFASADIFACERCWWCPSTHSCHWLTKWDFQSRVYSTVQPSPPPPFHKRMVGWLRVLTLLNILHLCEKSANGGAVSTLNLGSYNLTLSFGGLSGN